MLILSVILGVLAIAMLIASVILLIKGKGEYSMIASSTASMCVLVMLLVNML